MKYVYAVIQNPICGECGRTMKYININTIRCTTPSCKIYWTVYDSPKILLFPHIKEKNDEELRKPDVLGNRKGKGKTTKRDGRS